ncbi:MAG TPA: response regulator transcription factor [Isosphaeraceae bacterium]|jgi:DNA-binding NarL/FixJ family response regulator|nr:response regulator transcription factor [Isosphaeraceae bacterium]
MITIVLAEGPRLVRQGLRALLAAEEGFRVVGDAADGPGALALAARHRPDLLVVGRRPGGDDLPGLLRGLARRSPRTCALVLAPAAELRGVEDLRPGFVAILSEDSDAVDLARAVRAAVAGRRHLGRPHLGPAEPGPDHPADADPLAPLTLREREVFFLAAEGHTSAEVSERLFISRRTVEAHRANLMRKLALRNQTGLVRFAIRRGLLSPDD